MHSSLEAHRDEKPKAHEELPPHSPAQRSPATTTTPSKAAATSLRNTSVSPTT